MTDDELLADLLLRWEELHEKGRDVPPRSCAGTARTWPSRLPSASMP